MYIGYYCCQSTYADLYINETYRLKWGETLLSHYGHKVIYNHIEQTINVEKMFRVVLIDRYLFEINIAKLIIKYYINSNQEFVQWEYLIN